MAHTVYARVENRDTPETAAFQVRVKAPNEEEIPVDVAEGGSCTVLAFKGLLEGKSGVPLNSQRLVFGGRVLKNEDTLSKSGIQHGTFVHLFPLPENFVVNEGSARTEEQANNDSLSEVRPTESVGRISHGGFPQARELIQWQLRIRLFCIVGVFYCVMSLADEVPYCLGFESALSPGAKARYNVYAESNTGQVVVFSMLLHFLGAYVNIAGIRASKTLSAYDARHFLFWCVAFILCGVVETTITTRQLWYKGGTRFPNPAGGRDFKMELTLDLIFRFCLAAMIYFSARRFLELTRRLHLHNNPQENLPDQV